MSISFVNWDYIADAFILLIMAIARFGHIANINIDYTMFTPFQTKDHTAIVRVLWFCKSVNILYYLTTMAICPNRASAIVNKKKAITFQLRLWTRPLHCDQNDSHNIKLLLTLNIIILFEKITETAINNPLRVICNNFLF